MNRRLVFLCRGPDVAPYRKPKRARFDLVELVWHPSSIAALEARKLDTDADFVFADPDRTKRKFVCFADSAKLLPLEAYASVAIVDDDLELGALSWDDVFDAFEKTPLVIAQPALTYGSFSPWRVTRADSACSYRVTDFVEVMVPLFTRASLAACLPFFHEDRNGWGLEALWSNRFKPIGILDSVPITHSRPVGSAHSMTGHAVHPEVQAAAFRAKYKLALVKGRTLARIGKLGEPLEVTSPRCPVPGCRRPAEPLSRLCPVHRTGEIFA